MRRCSPSERAVTSRNEGTLLNYLLSKVPAPDFACKSCGCLGVQHQHVPTLHVCLEGMEANVFLCWQRLFQRFLPALSEIADLIFWSLREADLIFWSLREGTILHMNEFLSFSFQCLSRDRFSSICSPCAAKQPSRTAFHFHLFCHSMKSTKRVLSSSTRSFPTLAAQMTRTSHVPSI